ncbi:hypothetical protein [Maribacter sp. 2-571]|uniref:hypothetical protein n=1 Tax=Maribacter sp. 2-571 TaxID=3417569 RepID=UPI003D345624
MKQYTIIFLFVYAVHFQAQSQFDGATFLERTAFKIGYHGNVFSDNGLHLGAEYLWKEKIRVKEKRKGPKTITHQLLFNGSIGYVTNFTNRTDNGLHTHYGLIWRRTSPKRWQWNLEVNPLGYYRSFLPETFEVKGDEVSKVQFPGRSYYAPSVAIGIGRDRPEKRRSGWYLNLNCTLRTPYNAGTLPTFSVQYGHRFNFKKK